MLHSAARLVKGAIERGDGVASGEEGSEVEDNDCSPAHHLAWPRWTFLISSSRRRTRWVLYAVKGKLGKGEDLVPGIMLDLKSMQEAGEEIYNIPVSEEEMKSVVESVYGELPEVKWSRFPLLNC
jgi:hypothetical protein